ncbi:MAG: hypothetical protein CR975_02045 [Gammaproteobacteria bacterium]|nr:MAG: hypothetical protein CR975_02045 [Gammaproteobacteria bacterium]
MNGFIATTPPAAEDNFVIDDFFPALSLADFRCQYRLDGSYTTDNLKRALTDAAVDVTDDLSTWKLAYETDGHHTLAACPARQINGKSRLVILFEQAVFCFAKANLIDTFRDVDTTRKLGDSRAEDHELSSDYWRREGRAAIHKLLGRPTVESVLL